MAFLFSAEGRSRRRYRTRVPVFLFNFAIIELFTLHCCTYVLCTLVYVCVSECVCAQRVYTSRQFQAERSTRTRDGGIDAPLSLAESKDNYRASRCPANRRASVNGPPLVGAIRPDAASALERGAGRRLAATRRSRKFGKYAMRVLGTAASEARGSQEPRAGILAATSHR